MSLPLARNLNLNEESTQVLQVLHVLGQCEVTPSRPHLSSGKVATQLQYLLINVLSFSTRNRKDESLHIPGGEVLEDVGEGVTAVGTTDGDDVTGTHVEQVWRQVFAIPLIEHLLAVSVSIKAQDR